MENLWNCKEIYKAVFYATKAFGKKYPSYDENKKSYTAHFTSVALNSINYTANEKLNHEFMLVVAILHDVLEDTDITYQDLINDFNIDIADAVKTLSRDERLPFNEQIPDCLNRIKNQPKEVAIVKMADRLYNIRERYNGWTKEHQDMYKKEAQLVCDELGYASINMKKALQLAIDEY